MSLSIVNYLTICLSENSSANDATAGVHAHPYSANGLRLTVVKQIA